MDIRGINNFFGDINIDLMDQILKGRFAGKEKILDIGCGQGRNLIYFINRGCDLFGVDKDPAAISMCQYIAQELGFDRPDRFTTQNANALSFEDEMFDAVISTSVLHFARDKTDFMQAWSEQKRVLKKKGILFAIIDSNLGFESVAVRIDDWKWKFNDGSIRFLLTDVLLSELEVTHDFEWVQPVKTVNFGNQHAHSILVLEKK